MSSSLTPPETSSVRKTPRTVNLKRPRSSDVPQIKPRKKPNLSMSSEAAENPDSMQECIEQPECAGLSLDTLDEIPCPFLDDVEVPDSDLLAPADSEELPLAATSGLLDNTTFEKSWTRNNAVTAANKLLYCTYHYLPDHTQVEFLFPADTEPGDRQTLIRRNAKRQMVNWQRKTGDFIENGIHATAKLYDPFEFTAAPIRIRRELWGKIFSRNPYLITKGMLGTPAKVLALENLFFGDYQKCQRAEWRALFKTIFVWACEDMMGASSVKADGTLLVDRRVFYDEWKVMTERPSFLGLLPGIWKLENMPVKACRDQSSAN